MSRWYGRAFASLGIALVGAMFLVPSAADAAVISTFNNLNSWNSAVARPGPPKRVFVENFNDQILIPGLSFASTAGSIGGGTFNDRVTASGGESTTFFFNFGQVAYGVGGNWDLAGPGGPGESLNLTVSLFMGGNQLVGTAPTIPNTLAGGFFGFVSDTAFDSVRITSANIPASASAETYSLENLRIAVPEPGTLALFGLGLAGLGFMMRRRRRLA